MEWVHGPSDEHFANECASQIELACPWSLVSFTEAHYFGVDVSESARIVTAVIRAIDTAINSLVRSLQSQGLKKADDCSCVACSDWQTSSFESRTGKCSEHAPSVQAPPPPQPLSWSSPSRISPPRTSATSTRYTPCVPPPISSTMAISRQA